MAQPIFGQLHHVFVLHDDLARSRFDQPVQVADQSRFSRAGQAHDHCDFPTLHIHIDVVESQNMFMLRQQFLLAHTTLNMAQSVFVAGAEDLV